MKAQTVIVGVTLMATTLIVTQSGIGAESSSTVASVTAKDQEVLDLVVTDLLSKNSGNTPVSGRSGPPEGLVISSRSATWPIAVEGVLYRHGPGPWRKFPEAARPKLREAAVSIVRRVKGGGFSGFKSADARVTVREGSYAEDEERDPFFDRPMHAWPPGYSSDGSLAVVCLSIPWSIHSSTATYVLSRTGSSWTILVRQFVYSL